MRVEKTNQAGLSENAIPNHPIRINPTRLSPDVERYFESFSSDFGCTNLLDVHIPSTEQAVTLAKNAMTLDYAVARAFQLENYHQNLRSFAGEKRSSLPNNQLSGTQKGWFSNEGGNEYARHLDTLDSFSSRKLAKHIDSAAAQSVHAVHLFGPKHCNLACRGCYASSFPVDRFPFKQDDVESYIASATKVIREAKALGARVIQSSGDGEMLIYPRFFDLLEFMSEQGMQWLIFTAALTLSCEDAARANWTDAKQALSSRVRSRIQARILYHQELGAERPTVEAFLDEFRRHRDSLHIYHSVWSMDATLNSRWRGPRFSDYRYEQISTPDGQGSIPSSLRALMEIFEGSHRERLGIDMPICEASAKDVPIMARFVMDEGLKSYFQPILVTGRARRGMPLSREGANSDGQLLQLSRASANHPKQDSFEEEETAPPSEEQLSNFSSLFVRSQCSFRFLNQPVFKVRSKAAGFPMFASPGAAIDLEDLESLGVLDSLRLSNDESSVFSRLRSPLIVHYNYRYSSGCKCNGFSQRLLKDRSRLQSELRSATEVDVPKDLSVTSLKERLLQSGA